MNKKANGQKRKSLDKPLCKYGISCYQKNPEHRKKFKHPQNKDVNQNSLNDAADMIPERSQTPVKNLMSDSPMSSHLRFMGSNNVDLEETVDEVLKSMPKDFFDFWDFCSEVDKLNPQDVFVDFGYKLVGVYDLLAKKLPKDMKVNISCHWRYFYDPPEFQTVIRKDGNDFYHIGYFRDDPSEKPSILASNCANVDEKLTLMGDNIFCAMNIELNNVIKTAKSETFENKANKLQEELQKFAARKKYSINVQTSKTKERQRKVVAKTFHGLGIVVPMKGDIGYRPLPESNASLKKILKNIVSAENEDKRLEREEFLDEIETNVHIANDECDYGMGLELGIDLFCYGDPYFHKNIEAILSTAYKLLKRQKYELIIKAHLKQRKKGEILHSLNT